MGRKSGIKKSIGTSKSGIRAGRKRPQPKLTDVEQAIEEIRERRRQLWKEFGGSAERIAEHGQKVLEEFRAQRAKAARRRKKSS